MDKWHPMLAAVEGPTGTWLMIDTLGYTYGTIELRRLPDGQARYKAICRGQVIGWAITLRIACERVHRTFVASQGPVPFAGYPDLSGSARRKG